MTGSSYYLEEEQVVFFLLLYSVGERKSKSMRGGERNSPQSAAGGLGAKPNVLQY